MTRSGSLKSALAALVLLLTTGGVAAAQEGAITGTVTSGITGEELESVQVFIPDTPFGTLTDQNGRYRLAGVPVGERVVRVIVIGYMTAEQLVTVTAGEVATADFVLEVEAVALDEVVATITGEARRRELATNRGNVDIAAVQDFQRNEQTLDALKGQVTSVYIRKNSGTVGTGSDIRIRGSGSIGLDNTPLIVVDGAIIDNDNNELDDGGVFPDIFTGGQATSRLSDIDPDEIESVEVIKGPAASALYGARGNAGVILLTTKRGRTGQTVYNLRADLGQGRDVTEWVTTAWNPQSFFGTGVPDTLYTLNLFENPPPGSSREDALRNGFIQRYSADITGGTGTFGYFFTGKYENEQGTWTSNQLERFNLRANFNVVASPTLDVSVSNGYTSSFLRLPDNDNNIFGFIGNALVGFPWDFPIIAADPVTGEPGIETCGFNKEVARLIGAPISVADQIFGPCSETGGFFNAPFSDVATIFTQQSVERYTGSANVTYRPLDAWDWRFTLGYDQVNDRQNKTFPVDPSLPWAALSLGDISKVNQTNRNLTLQLSTNVRYGGTDWRFQSSLGGQYFRTTQESSLGKGQVFPGTAPTIGNSLSNQADDAFDEQRSVGIFVEQSFGWRNKIFLTPGLRFDDNSASGQNLGIQAYPKAGFSWVVAEPGSEGVFSSLRLRAAWGQSGSLPLTNAAKGIAVAQNATFQDVDILGVTRLQKANEELEPERAEEWEAGFDASFLRDRLGLTFAYYNQRTKNSVVAKDLAPSEGFPDEQFTNVGETLNRGVEVEFDALALETRNVSWDWRVIYSFNQNKVTELDNPIFFGFGARDQLHQRGLPFASYMSPKWVVEGGEARIVECSEVAGTWGTDDEPGPKELFCDPDDNRFWVGEPTPRHMGAIQTTLTLFRYVTLYAMVDAQGGHHLQNGTEGFHCGFLGGGKPAETGGGVALSCHEKDANGEFTDEALIKQQAGFTDSAGPFVYEADWAKLRTVSLRFDLPESWLRATPFRDISLQLVGENLAVWTDYGDDLSPGVDPEINFAGQFQAIRAEFLTQAPSRRFLGAIRIAF